jgi:hypothetical protein
MCKMYLLCRVEREPGYRSTERLAPEQGVAACRWAYPPGARAARLPPPSGGAGVVPALAQRSPAWGLRQPQPMAVPPAGSAAIALRGNGGDSEGMEPLLRRAIEGRPPP